MKPQIPVLDIEAEHIRMMHTPRSSGFRRRRGLA